MIFTVRLGNLKSQSDVRAAKIFSKGLLKWSLIYVHRICFSCQLFVGSNPIHQWPIMKNDGFVTSLRSLSQGIITWDKLLERKPWVRRFKDCRQSMESDEVQEDLAHPGLQTLSKRCRLVLQDRRITIRESFDEIDISVGTCHYS